MGIASWFWRHKPQDINKPIVLRSSATIPEILTNVRFAATGPKACANTMQAGIVLQTDYVYTPLDFLNNEEWFINMAWTRGRKFLRNASLGFLWNEDRARPVKKLRSDILPSLSLPLMIICEHLVIGYSAIFLAGWNIEFPTPTERLLWRVTSSIMLGFGVLGGWLFFFIDLLIVRKKQRNAASDSALRTIGQSSVGWLLPRGLLVQSNRQPSAPAGWEDMYFQLVPEVPRPLLMLAATMSVIYFWTRVFILVEDFVSLRSLPSGAFAVVAWTKNLPHS